MNLGFALVFNSILLGVGLAMDAFSVSLANGLNDHGMKRSKVFGIAGMFAFFQALMPMIGWVCVHTFVQCFTKFEKFIPWIALVLLLFIGGKMLIEGLKNDCDEGECRGVGFWALVVQGIATSIDALSVGFTIADYNWLEALLSALIIAVVTFFICWAGVVIGRKFGTRLASKASVFGGIILIFIGIEIFISGMIG